MGNVVGKPKPWWLDLLYFLSLVLPPRALQNSLKSTDLGLLWKELQSREGKSKLPQGYGLVQSRGRNPGSCSAFTLAFSTPKMDLKNNCQKLRCSYRRSGVQPEQSRSLWTSPLPPHFPGPRPVCRKSPCTLQRSSQGVCILVCIPTHRKTTTTTKGDLTGSLQREG